MLTITKQTLNQFSTHSKGSDTLAIIQLSTKATPQQSLVILASTLLTKRIGLIVQHYWLNLNLFQVYLLLCQV